MSRRLASALVLLGFAAAAPSLAGPADVPPAQGFVVFARDGHLWSVAAAGGEPQRVADLGIPAEETVGSLRVSAGGGLAVVESASGVRWVQLRAGEVRRAAVAPCSGPVRLAPDGAGFLCAGPSGAVFQPVAWRHRALAVNIDAAALLPGRQVLFAADGKLWRSSVTNLSGRTPVANHAPLAHLLPSPDGTRAVGFYTAQGGEHLHTFRIDDHRAVRRTLAGPSTPLAWSGDGRWLLTQDNRNRACAIRSVGGETLCWNGFTGLGLAPDGRHVLLTKKGTDASASHSLYVAPVRGVSAKKPSRLIEDIQPAAAWWPP